MDEMFAMGLSVEQGILPIELLTVKQVAEVAPKYGNAVNVVVHGTSDGKGFVGFSQVSDKAWVHSFVDPQIFLSWLRCDGWKNEPMVLYACHAGEDIVSGAAAQLARVAKVPVTAPRGKVTVEVDFIRNSMKATVTRDGQVLPKGSYWITIMPDGSLSVPHGIPGLK